ncbi:MAG: hypothetical protein MZV63_49280 [Marinilabiliales bacterium]|nr:hypothetical protein [Marinilabiliales bacterium]
MSRRTHLDIATRQQLPSLIRMEGETIAECRLSAGGVSPVPLFLKKTCKFFDRQACN